MLLPALRGVGQTHGLVTVAVDEFRTEGLPSGEAWLGRSFANAIIGHLSRSRQVRVVEREYLEKIMREWALQMSGAVDERSAVEVGKLLGAQIFIFGSVAKYESGLIGRARAVSVERGDILGVCEAQGNEQQLLQIQKKLGTELAAIMAVEAALADSVSLAAPELSMSVFETLDRLAQLCARFPALGLEPGHERKQAEYYLALTLSEKILSEAPRLAKALLYRGKIHLHLKDYSHAQQDILTARAISPDDPECVWALANLHFLQRQYAEAARVFKEGVTSFPDDARGWYGLGRVFIAASQHAEAVKALILASERSPTIAEIDNNLRAVLQSPDRNALLAELQKNPGLQAAAHLFLATWTGDHKAAFSHVAEALRSHPNLYLSHYVAGLKAMAEGKKELARQQFKETLSLRPAYPPVHRELGLLALDLGDQREGKEHLKIYLKTAAHIDDYDAIQKKLDRIR
jgi:tetratricopeptide (TPR) repeat protein